MTYQNQLRRLVSPLKPGIPRFQIARILLNAPRHLRIQWHSSACNHENKHNAPPNTTTSCKSKAPGTCKEEFTPPISLSELRFWGSVPTWRRAAVNTFRCLVGCTIGDFSAMWLLQAWYPGLGIGTIMAISMASGVSTSMALETVLLRLGQDKLSWLVAAKTAAGMSLISMLTMEMAQNMVDYHLTGGTVAFQSPGFWMAAVVAMSAGFLAPLPYNYIRLRKYGKACH